MSNMLPHACIISLYTTEMAPILLSAIEKYGNERIDL